MLLLKNWFYDINYTRVFICRNGGRIVGTNLSKIRREKMLNTISKIKENIDDEELLKNLCLIEHELTKKKYGLLWEEHEEKVDEELKTKIPTFEEVKDKEIVSNKNDKFNFLLEGDNLHSLYLLEKTHKGEIDLIYIDPPYNTGNKDFIYDDCMVDREDGFSHSKWLSFMEKRLNIAKKLLKENGVIFISIDDYEQAPLKILCDDIFGEDNFIANIIWKRKRGRDNSAKWFSKAHEYCLVYSKNKNLFDVNKVEVSEDSDTRKAYKNPDNDSRGDYRKLGCWARGTQGGVKYDFTLSDGYYFYERLWLMSKENLKKLDDENKLVRVGDKLYRKFFITEHKGQVPETIWDNVSNSANASDMIKKMFNGNIIFDTAKPVEYIKRMFQIGSKKNATILDFFAGSGTTAQAVLELNQEDNGNRQFILCTNNENNICEDITYQRIKTVITGKRKDNTKYSNGINSNLKYYKTTYIPRLNTEEEDIQENLLLNIKNLIQLENGISVDDERIKVILEEEKLDTFSLNVEEIKKCEKLYISSDILLTTRQVKALKENNVEVYVIPEYYFDSEIKEVP